MSRNKAINHLTNGSDTNWPFSQALIEVECKIKFVFLISKIDSIETNEPHNRPDKRINLFPAFDPRSASVDNARIRLADCTNTFVASLHECFDITF